MFIRQKDGIILILDTRYIKYAFLDYNINFML